MNRYKYLLLSLLFLQGTAQAQQFLEGINLYNRAQYDSLISIFVPDFLASVPQEEGLARYFLAESYYNKAMIETDEATAINYFERAREEFKRAEASADLRADFVKHYHIARYKIGWCSFRMAEMSGETAEGFSQAYDAFTRFAPDAPDSVKAFSNYMAAESKTREMTARSLATQDKGQSHDNQSVALDAYPTIQTLYDNILRMPATPTSPSRFAELKFLTRLARERLNLIYPSNSVGLPSIEDARGLASDSVEAARQAVLRHLNAASFENLATGLSREVLDEHRPTVDYLEMNQELGRYLLTRNHTAWQRFMGPWSRLAGTPGLEIERRFRRANLAQGHPDAQGVEFNNFAPAFYDSSRNEPEALYWGGYVRMIQGQNEKSRRQFAAFQAKLATRGKLGRRQQTLLEDAIYRTYLLDFESAYLGRRQRELQTLRQEIAAFNPANRQVGERVDQLNLLVNCAVTTSRSQIWNGVLAGDKDEKLEQALATIRFVLPRAALNIGVVRARYVSLLQRLFEITKVERRDDTNFFHGIVMSLEAEIEATRRAKERKFQAAANAMAAMQSSFENKDEADYIRARSLFFADEFEEAKEILVPLINDKGYLRALFYLAEIFRQDGQGFAAKRCYQAIVRKLQKTHNVYDDFWLENARAGMESADGSGSLAVLDSVDLENIEFQPARNPALLAYEKLADERFLKARFAQESVDWLLRFGLPIKSFYPSRNRLNARLVVESNTFTNTPYQIEEIRGALTSTLHLTVELPKQVPADLRVYLDSEILTARDGVYEERFLRLNSELELRIENDDCYAFKQVHTFSKPGVDRLLVKMNKVLTFEPAGEPANISAAVAYPFEPRVDRNFVLNAIPAQSQDSQLRRDFSRYLEVRDCVVDPAGDRILAVNSKTNSVWTYSNSESAQRDRQLRLRLSTPLKSPEGIAVNSGGEIFVADWGNHRVVRFAGNGEFIASYGTFGTNGVANLGQPVRLANPTRIALVQDSAGVDLSDQVYLPQDYFYVADQNGIHVCEMDGTYLDTLIKPGATLKAGEFYGFLAENEPTSAKLFVINRLGAANEEVLEFAAGR